MKKQLMIAEGELRQLIWERLVREEKRRLMEGGGGGISVLAFLQGVLGYYGSEEYVGGSGDLVQEMLQEMKRVGGKWSQEDRLTYHEENVESEAYGAKSGKERIEEFVYYVDRFFGKYRGKGVAGVNVTELFRFLLKHVYDKQMGLMRKEVRGVFEMLSDRVVPFVKRYQALGIKIGKMQRGTSKKVEDVTQDVGKMQQGVKQDSVVKQATEVGEKVQDVKVSAATVGKGKETDRKMVGYDHVHVKGEEELQRVFGTAAEQLKLNNGKPVESQLNYVREEMEKSALWDNNLDQLIGLCQSVSGIPDARKYRVLQNNQKYFSKIYLNWEQGKYAKEKSFEKVVEHFLGKFNRLKQQYEKRFGSKE